MVSFKTARGPRGNRPKANNQGGTPTVELGTSHNAQRTNPRCVCHDLGFSAATLLWTPAQRKRASMLYFANVFFYIYLFIFMAALFSGPG